MIINMDCVEGMRQLPAAFFDVCISDPEYGDTSLEWDKIDNEWIAEASRVLKSASSMWVFGSMRYFAENRVFGHMHDHGFRYSQDIVWEKQNGTGFHNDRFRRVHEHCVLFYRGKWSEVYHQTQYTNDATAKTVRRKTRPTHTGHIEAGHYVSEDGGPRMQRSVMQVRNEHGRAIHPTQKPIDLLQPLIRYSVPPDGRVLVPFSGSGAVELACRNERRACVGFEISKEYADKAHERLKGNL